MPTTEPRRTLCGMRCDICPAYEPNRANADLQRASELWVQLFEVYIPPEIIACGGCRANAEALLDKQCPVRPCALARGVADCGQCPEMPCENLKRRWVSRPEIEAKLGHAIPDDDYRAFVQAFENAPYLMAGARRRKPG